MTPPPPSSPLFPSPPLFRPRSSVRTRHSRETGPRRRRPTAPTVARSEEHTSELQSRGHLVCRLLLEKKKKTKMPRNTWISDWLLVQALALRTGAVALDVGPL